MSSSENDRALLIVLLTVVFLITVLAFWAVASITGASDPIIINLTGGK